jgi:pimeloyl-ACP methyl ester carboxylesterase
MRPLPRAGLALLLAIVLVASAIYFVFPGFVLSVALDSEHARLGLVKRRVDIPGGLTMSYLEGGRGEPLVLLHGFGGDKDNFALVAPYLTPHYHVFVPDLIGFGESSHPADADYSTAAQADRVRAFCQALGVPWIHVGGNSMGGQIALSWAAAHPAEVASLWLLDPAGIWTTAPKSEVAKAVLAGGPNPLLVSTVADFDALIALTMSRPLQIPTFAKEMMAAQRRDNRALEERIFREVSGDSVEARIAGLKTSTLVVFGAQDRVIDPGTAQVLKKLLPHAHVVIMPGVGHLPMLEEPQHAASDYVRFRDSM